MLNTACLIGRITKDISIRETTNGFKTCAFSIAVNTGKEDTSFFDCVALGKNAEVMEQFCHKGDQIGVTGWLHQRKWTTKDGRNASAVEIVVDQLQLLEAKKEVPEADVESIPVEVPEGYHMDENGNLIKDKPSTKK